jgi:hypothetical protein
MTKGFKMTKNRLLRGGVAAVAMSFLAAPGFAETAAPAPSSNAMINLVRLLVAQGTISRAKGDELIAEAQREAQAAVAAQQTTSQSAVAAVAPVPGTAAGRAADGKATAALAAPPAGTIRVPYIPETVRQQIRDEVKADVLAQAEKQGWASPGKAAPDWVHNILFYGDFRLRSQSSFYSRFNSTQVPNFQAIVNAGPVDLINSQIPILNTTQDRSTLLLRARLGVEFTIDPRLKVGVEVATGDDSSPLSASTNLAGGFNKRSIYVHKAFIQARPTDNLTLTAGRMENPFQSTTVLFDPEVRLDGFAVEGRTSVESIGIDSIKLRGGAFPLGVGSANFPNTATTKAAVPQKWLFAGQVESDFAVPGNGHLDLAVGYYHYLNISGEPSAPCALYLGATQCSTDPSAAFFVQKGNTLSFIRRIVLDPTLPSSTVQAQPQLLGLTSAFHILNATAVYRLPTGPHTEFSFTADYLRNLAFNRADACRYGVAGQPVNNGGSGGNGNICDPTPANRTPYVGGGNGYDVLAAYGYPAPRNRGEWRVFAGYRYIESDAVLDAFTDQYFHLGGTNAKGYVLGGVLGVWRNTTIGARWLSANQVSGDPLAIDVLQLDLNVAF